jgi:hypothetical protein
MAADSVIPTTGGTVTVFRGRSPDLDPDVDDRFAFRPASSVFKLMTRAAEATTIATATATH